MLRWCDVRFERQRAWYLCRQMYRSLAVREPLLRGSVELDRFRL
jgi:hypothetical protein